METWQIAVVVGVIVLIVSAVLLNYFLQRRAAFRSGGGSPPAEPGDPTGSSQHYVFAHRELPGLAFADPTRMLGILQGPDGLRFCSRAWERAGEQVHPQLRSSGEGLFVRCGKVAPDVLLATIALPPPRESPEAWFVGLVAQLPPDATTLDAVKQVRVITLEESHDYQRDVRCTMLCEWTADGTHHNHGDGPEAEEGAFVGAVLRLLGGG